MKARKYSNFQPWPPSSDANSEDLRYFDRAQQVSSHFPIDEYRRNFQHTEHDYQAVQPTRIRLVVEMRDRKV
ncbi:MAG: hypothetical protein KDD34_10180 [Bdellovibrionales bacterium]|nr:hypothetical protein [Bdellovibrionales bacterium]